MAAAIYILSSISYTQLNTPFSARGTMEIYTMRTVVYFGGVALLFAYQSQLRDLLTQREADALRNMLHIQYENYKIRQESIDLINQKYHDLKHQIAVLRAESGEKRNAVLDNMEQEIKAYEAQNDTGNKVLDTVLTGKSLTCRTKNIQLTCVADGTALDFMDVMDISNLFGNALDNAIESVEKLPDSEQRLIHLVVARQKSFLWVRVENTYDGAFQADRQPAKNYQDRRPLPRLRSKEHLRHRRKIRRHGRNHHPGEPVHIKGAVSHQAEITRTAHFGGLFFTLSNLHIKRMIRLSISPMPQAACAGKTTVHVVNPLFAVHCDIVQTTEKESLRRFCYG